MLSVAGIKKELSSQVFGWFIGPEYYIGDEVRPEKHGIDLKDRGIQLEQQLD